MFDLQEHLESDLVVSGLQLSNSDAGATSRNMESQDLLAHIGAKEWFLNGVLACLLVILAPKGFLMPAKVFNTYLSSSELQDLAIHVLVDGFITFHHLLHLHENKLQKESHKNHGKPRGLIELKGGFSMDHSTVCGPWPIARLPPEAP